MNERKIKEYKTPHPIATDPTYTMLLEEYISRTLDYIHQYKEHPITRTKLDTGPSIANICIA